MLFNAEEFKYRHCRLGGMDPKVGQCENRKNVTTSAVH